MKEAANHQTIAHGQIKFQQGNKPVCTEGSSDNDVLDSIKSKLSDMSNLKNLHFLLGAGASSDAIPAMSELLTRVDEEVGQIDELAELYFTVRSGNDNLESLLGTLYSKREYDSGIGRTDDTNDCLINFIEKKIYRSINVDIESKNSATCLSLYKEFYQILSTRNKDLSRANVFTTNNDLFSETALSYLNINYNNGFSSGLIRNFNPARFSFTFSRKIDSGLEKYQPIGNMVYLYKLHGSINWIESDDNSLFKIKEVDITPSLDPEKETILIYPTPLKQNKSLGAPYSDLIREFQNKLQLEHGALIVIGYSFSDEHINNAIYSALASNPSLNVFIFGNVDKNTALTKIPDSRIYQSSGLYNGSKIHYFDFIVSELLPHLNENKDSDLIDKFISQMNKAQGN